MASRAEIDVPRHRPPTPLWAIPLVVLLAAFVFANAGAGAGTVLSSIRQSVSDGVERLLTPTPPMLR